MSSDKSPQYTLTPQAQADLEDIWRYTAETWSIEQADKYVRELADTFGLMVSMPFMARQRTEFEPPVRIHLHETHLIVYLIESHGIEILRILGGHQDWMSILNDTEQ